MLFYFDKDGKAVSSIPNAIFQGSVGVNEILVLAPFPKTTVVTAAFVLPNGLKLYPRYVNGVTEGYTLASVSAFEIPAPDGVTVNLWKMKLDKALTQQSGDLSVQFTFTGSGDESLTTETVNLSVSRGNPKFPPDVTDDAYDVILKATQTAQIASENATQTLAILTDSYTFFNEVIGFEPELWKIEAASGRVLVKDVSFTSDLNNKVFIVGQDITHLEFANCSIAGNITITFKGHNGCTVRNARFNNADMSILNYVNFENFGNVEKCGEISGIYYFFTNCSHISDSVISYAKNCRFIDNCDLYSESEASFKNCSFINNITENDSFGTGGVIFENCSFISNVDAIGQYVGCTYVDAETCDGYIPESDVGKVQVLTNDGSFEAVELPYTGDLVKITDFDNVVSQFGVIVDNHESRIATLEAGGGSSGGGSSGGGSSGGSKLYEHFVKINCEGDFNGSYYLDSGTIYATFYRSTSTPLTFDDLHGKRFACWGTCYLDDGASMLTNLNAEVRTYPNGTTEILVEALNRNAVYIEWYSFTKDECTVTDTVTEV